MEEALLDPDNTAQVMLNTSIEKTENRSLGEECEAEMCA